MIGQKLGPSVDKMLTEKILIFASTIQYFRHYDNCFANAFVKLVVSVNSYKWIIDGSN